MLKILYFRYSAITLTLPVYLWHRFAFVDRTASVIRRPGISIVGQFTESDESSFLIHQGGYHDLFVCP